MIVHTLTEHQSSGLAETLKTLLPKITESEKLRVGKRLYSKLKTLVPKEGRTWTSIHLDDDEEQLFKILVELQWGKPHLHSVKEHLTPSTLSPEEWEVGLTEDEKAELGKVTEDEVKTLEKGENDK